MSVNHLEQEHDESKDKGANHVEKRSYLYNVTIFARQLVPYEELDGDDKDENIVGGHHFYDIEAYSEEEAEKIALDEFHETVPIANLDNYEIVSEILVNMY